jgi:hypothetical protein
MTTHTAHWASDHNGRSGYVGTAVVEGIMLWLVNRWPGWEAVPFLTRDTELVLGLVNATLLVTLLANLVYAVADPPRLRAFGDLVIAVVGLVAVVRIRSVFPFDLSSGWETAVRVLLVLALVVNAIWVVGQVALVIEPRLAGGHGRVDRRR